MMRARLLSSTSPQASVRGIIAVVLVIGVTLLSGVLGAEEIEVRATVETQPVPTAGDCADDSCIWVHPTDPALSVVIGTAKTGRTAGLHVYDISGKEIQHVRCGQVNNVDVRYNFPLGGKRVDLVAATNRSHDSIALFTVEPRTRRLVDVAGRRIKTVKSNYGFCMYRSARTGRYYGFVISYGGKVEQWRLFDNGEGKVDGKLVRRFDVGSISEGCVADDELGHFYVSEERKAIWKYGAEPGDGDKRTMVDRGSGHFRPDVEGLTIYYARGGTGYLIASSQGNSAFAVYKREGKNDYVKTFRIVQGRGVDAVGGTDGIDVANVPLGPAFPKGVFVAQDNNNPGANQNFKLVPWESIARTGTPVLTIDTTWDPRKAGPSRGPNRTADVPRLARQGVRSRGTVGQAGRGTSSAPEMRFKGGRIRITGGTGEKPQSKLWYSQGAWWGAFPQTDGVRLWKLDGKDFVRQKNPVALKGTSGGCACDVASRNDTVFILAFTHADEGTTLHKLARKADRYVTEDRYPVAVPLPRAVETATCDVDSRGLVWIAYVDQEKLRTVVRVFNPERPADGVGPEIELGAGMSRDDIASVVAFKGHVGVFWSDQKSDHFFFRVHADGEDPAKWAPAETIGSTRGVADDHVNLAADSEGRVWTVTKDGFDQFTLRRRSTDGKWDAAVPILPKEVVATRPGPRADGTRPGGTRPIVVLCEETQTAFVAYTDWAHKPMRVCLHPVSMTSLHVGPMLPIIHGPHGFNNVTSTKAPITRKSGLLLLARGTRTRWVILPLPLLADRR